MCSLPCCIWSRVAWDCRLLWHHWKGISKQCLSKLLLVGLVSVCVQLIHLLCWFCSSTLASLLTCQPSDLVLESPSSLGFFLKLIWVPRATHRKVGISGYLWRSWKQCSLFWRQHTSTSLGSIGRARMFEVRSCDTLVVPDNRMHGSIRLMKLELLDQKIWI